MLQESLREGLASMKEAGVLPPVGGDGAATVVYDIEGSACLYAFLELFPRGQVLKENGRYEYVWGGKIFSVIPGRLVLKG